MTTTYCLDSDFWNFRKYDIFEVPREFYRNFDLFWTCFGNLEFIEIYIPKVLFFEILIISFFDLLQIHEIRICCFLLKLLKMCVFFLKMLETCFWRGNLGNSGIFKKIRRLPPDNTHARRACFVIRYHLLLWLWVLRDFARCACQGCRKQRPDAIFPVWPTKSLALPALVIFCCFIVFCKNSYDFDTFSFFLYLCQKNGCL